MTWHIDIVHCAQRMLVLRSLIGSNLKIEWPFPFFTKINLETYLTIKSTWTLCHPRPQTRIFVTYYQKPGLYFWPFSIFFLLIFSVWGQYLMVLKYKAEVAIMLYKLYWCVSPSYTTMKMNAQLKAPLWIHWNRNKSGGWVHPPHTPPLQGMQAMSDDVV